MSLEPQPIDCLISARWVVPVEPEGVVLPNHSVAVREGAIPIEESWSPGFQPPFHPSCYCNMVPVVVKPLTKAAGHTHGLACDAP